MSHDLDAVLARRALARKLSFWRYGAIGVAVLAVLGLAMFAKGDGTAAFSDHIARIRIDGLITGDDETVKLVEEVAQAPRVSAVILRINSPGGTTAGSEALYESLKELAAEKPLVAVMDTVAASGGYIVALPAHHIVARGNTITGSIGVIFQWPDVSKLMNSLGVKMEELKSGELKAQPSPFNPTSPKVREVSQAMVADSFAWFTGLVAEQRKLTGAQVEALADGRVFTGRQALAAGLIDELGGEKQASAWFSKEKSIPEGLVIVDYKPAGDGWGEGFGAFSGILGGIGKVLVPERLSLDGLQSVWHP